MTTVTGIPPHVETACQLQEIREALSSLVTQTKEIAEEQKRRDAELKDEIVKAVKDAIDQNDIQAGFKVGKSFAGTAKKHHRRRHQRIEPNLGKHPRNPKPATCDTTESRTESKRRIVDYQEGFPTWWQILGCARKLSISSTNQSSKSPATVAHWQSRVGYSSRSTVSLVESCKASRESSSETSPTKIQHPMVAVFWIRGKSRSIGRSATKHSSIH